MGTSEILPRQPRRCGGPGPWWWTSKVRRGRRAVDGVSWSRRRTGSTKSSPLRSSGASRGLLRARAHRRAADEEVPRTLSGKCGRSPSSASSWAPRRTKARGRLVANTASLEYFVELASARARAAGAADRRARVEARLTKADCGGDACLLPVSNDPAKSHISFHDLVRAPYMRVTARRVGRARFGYSSSSSTAVAVQRGPPRRPLQLVAPHLAIAHPRVSSPSVSVLPRSGPRRQRDVHFRTQISQREARDWKVPIGCRTPAARARTEVQPNAASAANADDAIDRRSWAGWRQVAKPSPSSPSRFAHRQRGGLGEGRVGGVLRVRAELLEVRPARETLRPALHHQQADAAVASADRSSPPTIPDPR